MLKILIVDDNEVDRMVFIDLLSVLKPYITEAKTGKEALNFLKKECFNCILLDYQLPDVDGLTLLKEIRKITSTPIVTITAFGDERLVVEMLKNGAQDYIPKEKSSELLVDVVKNVVKLNKIQLKLQELQNKEIESLKEIQFSINERLKSY